MENYTNPNANYFSSGATFNTAPVNVASPTFTPTTQVSNFLPTPTVKPVAVLSSMQGQDILNQNTNTLQKIESGYVGPSIVDYLNSTGQASDFGTRSKLASEKGIANYTGTAAQNTQLLQALRNVSSSPASTAMVNDINKAVSTGGMTASERAGLDNLTKAQDEVTTAAAKARAALEAKDYRSMDAYVKQAEESGKVYENLLSEYYKSTADLRKQLTSSMTPTEKEQDLSNKLNSIRTQAEQFKVQTEEDKFREYEGQTMGFAGGRASEIDRKAEFKLQRMAIEEKNLLLSLGLEQEARKMTGDAAEMGLSFLAEDLELQTKVQEKLDQKEEKLFEMAQSLETDAKNTLLSVLDGLAGVDPANMSQETLLELEKIAARSGIPFNLITEALKTQHEKQVFDNALKTATENRLSKNSTANTKGTTVSGKLTYTPDMAQEDEQALQVSRGEDGFVDPAIYQKLYNAWIANGGLLKDFISKFPPKNYVNPENTWLPSFLIPPKKASDDSWEEELMKLLEAGDE